MITYSGLQKYNGYEFKTYTSDVAKPGTLTSNFVEDMFEDNDGDLIVALEDGIDIYDKSTDNFRNLIRDLPFAALRRNEISRLASAVQDKSKSIWINCNNQLVKIDSTKSDFIVYEDEYRGRFVLNRDSTSLLIITDRTFKKYDLKNRVLAITNIEDIPSPVRIRRLNTIFCDSEDICWVGTSDGLFIFNEDQGSFVDPASRIFPMDFSKGILQPYMRIIKRTSGWHQDPP
jgi:ligand-binding sensor domain-containing protein